MIKIGDKLVGLNQPVFIVAEAGVNHNGELKLAKKLIDVAAQAGVDAIKFQTFDPKTLVTKNAAKAKYQTNDNGRESQYEMLEKIMLPRKWHKELRNYAKKKGLIFLSTPFSKNDADFLIKLGVPAIKVSSSDANNIPYLTYIAAQNIPIILSTGMSDMEEIRESVKNILKMGNNKLIVLHCTTNYPTPFEEANIKAIPALAQEFGLIIGFSDHTLGIEAPIAAVAIGAKIIEKHFTLDKKLPGPDHKASLEPEELKKMTRSIRNIEKALGNGKKIPFPSEKKISNAARKSIIAIQNIKRGQIITADYIDIKRPGNGLSPKYYPEIIGAKAIKDIKADTLLKINDYEA
ncbi:MAG: N-acetylneuraminate synthase [Candidatus Taylorbacteria bacterium]|nr:N-acetylneuraminate synthase [Candidatus Taylorbacteria bacterium]